MYQLAKSEVGDYRLLLEQDEDAESPREWSNLGTFLTWHRGYRSPDANEFANPVEFDDWWKENGEGGTKLAVFMLDHSGVSYSTRDFGDPWDSGQIGWIYTTAAQVAEFGVDPENVAAALTGEVKVYSEWANGGAFGYILEHGEVCDHDEKHWDHVDSCWGFLGYDDVPALLRDQVGFPDDADAEALVAGLGL